MINKRILVVATYPIKQPEHGGQKRLDAICKEYKKGFRDVRFTAVFYKGFYAAYGKYDIHVGSSTEHKIQHSPYTGDITCGEAIYKDLKVRKRFTKMLLSYNPDIIHIEQPFPYLGLKPLLEELGMKPKIIFGSQNIEAPMKRQILEGLLLPESTIQKTERLISRLETNLTQESDLIIACTRNDEEAHKKMGARNIVLAPNGVAEVPGSEKARQYWIKKFEKIGIKNIVLFVGSAHPPNWTGFFDMVSKGLGFIPLDTRIVIAGSICDYFEQNIKEDSLNIENTTFWLRAFSAGRLSEEKLRALIALADVITLPITEGGGSNLKTAEAILADKKVVATDHALRSFEWFTDFPNVWVANNQKDFRESILKALRTSRQERSQHQKKQATSVLWKNCLKDMVKKAEEL
jgi:hypothetical protein